MEERLDTCERRCIMRNVVSNLEDNFKKERLDVRNFTSFCVIFNFIIFNN